MKYQLDGDLPHALAGTMLRESDGNLVIDAKDFILDGMRETIITGLVFCKVSDIPELLSQGWIREVKPREPREWWLNVGDSGGGVSYLYAAQYEAEVWAKGRDTIRVREVIEK